MAKQTYEVGPSRVLDHEPGTTFEADLNPVQRERLLQSGALTRVPPAPAKGDKPAAPKGGTPSAPEAGEKKEQ